MADNLINLLWSTWAGSSKGGTRATPEWAGFLVVETDPITRLQKMSDVKFARGIYGADLKSMKKDQVQAWMNEYFDAQVQIFDEDVLTDETDDVPDLYRSATTQKIHAIASVLLILTLTLAAPTLLTLAGTSAPAELKSLAILQETPYLFLATAALACTLLLWSVRAWWLLALSVIGIIVGGIAMTATPPDPKSYWAFSQTHPTLLNNALMCAFVVCLFSSVILHLVLRTRVTGAGLWPGFLEVRLMKFTKKKFQNVDADVRIMIDAFATIFETNLKQFIFLKRCIQALASIILVAATFWAAYWSDVAPWIIVIAVIVSGVLFYLANAWLRDDKYMVCLDKSCETIQHTLDQRLRSLSECIKESLIDLTQLRERGQYLSDATIEDDDHFEGMAGFFEMQKMLWLAKRSEYQELYLVDAIHKMRRTYFVLDRNGHGSAFFVTFVAALAGLLPAIWQFSNPSDQHILVQLCFLVPSAAIIAAGWASYSYAKWNTGADTLRKKLDSSRWITFAKLKIDTKLAGQYQRALGTIAKLNEQLAQRK